ncbi:MAG TPA: hypothetical protein VF624_05685 [Tepidisphaeraceae bacterium]|jgi:hypothetical protein
MRDAFGLPMHDLPEPPAPAASLVLKQHEMRRLLNFAGWTIDDVVQNPIARRDVARWFKLGRAMHRRLEVLELERQWNPLR